MKEKVHDIFGEQHTTRITFHNRLSQSNVTEKEFGRLLQSLSHSMFLLNQQFKCRGESLNLNNTY